MCDMTHSYVWHDSFICVTWLIHMCDMIHAHVWHDSFICVTRLIHMCDMTHSYVWHDSLTCVIWLIHMCDMTHSCVWHDSFICVTRLIHMCDMTHSYVWKDTRMDESCHKYDRMIESVFSDAWMSHVTHMDKSCQSIVYIHCVCDRTCCYTARCYIHVWLNQSFHTYEWVMTHIDRGKSVKVKNSFVRELSNI